MLKSKKPGLAVVETILVLAISGMLFAIVIGTFATRRKAAADDAAKQVMSEIAKVRNQAQQGYSPVPLSGKELFGTAIEINNYSSLITVRYLQQDPDTKSISTISGTDSIITMPNQLKWYINTNSASFNTDSGAISCPGPVSGPNFNSCNLTAAPTATGGYFAYPTQWLVFRNGTGNSYKLTPNNYQDQANYTSANQILVRFAFAQVSATTPAASDYLNSPAKYYANFDLAIPNNQSLQVVK